MDEKRTELIFEYALVFKAIFAFFEIVGGVAALFVTQAFLFKLIAALTQDELLENPSDVLVTYLTHVAEGFTINTKYFTSFYLVSHGAVKLFLIVGLLRKKLWFYPASMVVFGLFIVYQSYRFFFTHSLWLMMLTVIDIIVMWLTWHEYIYMKKNVSA